MWTVLPMSTCVVICSIQAVYTLLSIAYCDRSVCSNDVLLAALWSAQSTKAPPKSHLCHFDQGLRIQSSPVQLNDIPTGIGRFAACLSHKENLPSQCPIPESCGQCTYMGHGCYICFIMHSNHQYGAMYLPLRRMA